MYRHKNAPHFSRNYLLPAILLLFTAAPMVQAAPLAYLVDQASNSISAFDTATDAIVGSAIPVGNGPQGIAVSPDGSRVYVTNSTDNTLSIIDTATKSVSAISVGSGPRSVALSPDASLAYVVNNASSNVSVIDTATDAAVATIAVGFSPVAIAVSPDGSRAYVANYNYGTLSVIDTTSRSVVATITVGAYPQGVAVSPNGSRIYVSNSGDNTVSVLDPTTNSVVATVPVGRGPIGVVVTPDGGQIYVANNTDNTVSVIDAATNNVATVSVNTGPDGIAVSPDGSQVYVENIGSGTISVIDTASTSVTYVASVGFLPNSFGTFVGPGALVAANTSASASAGTQISGTVPTLANSTGCAATDVIVQNPAHGTVTMSSAGAYTYTPSSSTYSGPDAFTWRGEAASTCAAALAPTKAASNTATVSLTSGPGLAGLSDLTLGEGATAQETFTLTGTTPFNDTFATDNPTVLPSANISISPSTCGTAGHLSCTLAITAATVPGTATVTIKVTDQYGDSVQKALLVTVVAPPTMSGYANLSLTAGTGGSESLAIGGTGALSVAVSSSNTTLLPNKDITVPATCNGAGTCVLSIQAPSGVSGIAAVTVTLTDSYGQTVSGTFNVAIQSGSTSGSGGSGTSSGSGSGSGSGGGGASSALGLLMLLGLAALRSLKKYKRSYTQYDL